MVALAIASGKQRNRQHRDVGLRKVKWKIVAAPLAARSPWRGEAPSFRLHSPLRRGASCASSRDEWSTTDGLSTPPLVETLNLAFNVVHHLPLK